MAKKRNEQHDVRVLYKENIAVQATGRKDVEEYQEKVCSLGVGERGRDCDTYACQGVRNWVFTQRHQNMDVNGKKTL